MTMELASYIKTLVVRNQERGEKAYIWRDSIAIHLLHQARSSIDTKGACFWQFLPTYIWAIRLLVSLEEKMIVPWLYQTKDHSSCMRGTYICQATISFTTRSRSLNLLPCLFDLPHIGKCFLTYLVTNFFKYCFSTWNIFILVARVL